MVSPDGHLLDVSGTAASAQGELSDGSVVVKACHSCEAGGRQFRCIVLADERVGVGRVSNYDSFGLARAVVIDSFANINEDSSIVFEKISSLHPFGARLGTHQEVVIDVLKGCCEVTSDHNIFEEREGAVMELSLYTAEDLLLERQIK